MAPKTIIEKIWDEHVVRHEPGEPDLLYIDRHLVHEVTRPQAFEGLRLAAARCAGPTSRSPPSTTTCRPRDRRLPHRRPALARSRSRRCARTARSSASRCYIFDIRQGIVHIIGPEQGLTQPGMTIVCGD